MAVSSIELEQFHDLKARLDALEDELDAEREKRERAEAKADAAVAHIRQLWNQPTVEFRGNQLNPENLWIGDHPVGRTLENTKKRSDRVEDRLRNVEYGEVEAEDLVMADPEALLPIQQMANVVRADVDHDLSRNKELAARAWPHYRDYADVSQGSLTIKTPKFEDILERELDIKKPNSNTSRRAMKHLARFSDGLVEFDDSKHTNRLVAKKSEWTARMAEMKEAHQQAQLEANR